MNRAKYSGHIEVLRLSGNFDYKCSQQFRNLYEPLLSDDSIDTVEVHLGAVDYIDSSALGMLLLLRERAAKATKKVVLSHCGGTTRDVLEVAQFNQLFELN